MITAVSRITGFARNWAMATALGATLLTSSYVVANNIPNLLYELIAGGVLSSIFVPIFLERSRHGSDEKAEALASTLLNLALIVLGLVALGATLFPEPFVRTQTFTLRTEEASTAIYLFRFLAIQIVFYGAAVIMGGVLNARRRFLAVAFGPIANNIIVIATLFTFLLLDGRTTLDVRVAVLAIGTSLGVLAQTAVMVPSLLKTGFKYRPTIDLRDPALLKVRDKSLPIIIFVLVNIVSISARHAFAFSAETRLPGQGPAILQYAWMFYTLPSGIFAVALSTVIFPELSEHSADSDWAAFAKRFTAGIRSQAALILPSAALIFALAVPLCTLYVSGAFDVQDVSTTSEVLRMWVIALFSYTSVTFTVRAFYAIQDTKSPMLTNLLTMVLQVLLYAVLTRGLAGWDGMGLIGIPLADVIAHSAHLVVLLLLLRHKVGPLGVRGWFVDLWRVGAASIVGAGIAGSMLWLVRDAFDFSGGVVVQLFFAGGLGVIAVYASARALGVPETAYLHRRLSGLVTRFR